MQGAAEILGSNGLRAVPTVTFDHCSLATFLTMSTLSTPHAASPLSETPHADDHPLHSRVLKALATQTYLVGKNLRFETRAGRVTIHGKVRSFFLKQMAQETLKGIEGIAHIDNQMIVDWDAEQMPKQTTIASV